MSKSIVLAVLAEVFDIEMGRRGSGPFLPICFAGVPLPRRGARGIKRDATTAKREQRREEKEEEERPSSYFVDASVCRASGDSQIVPPSSSSSPCVRVLFILRPLRSHSRRVATCLFTLRDRPRQISPTRYLLPVAIPPREHIKG